MGIVAIAMIVGACAATVTLITGQSFLVALAIYSGCGVLGAGMLIAAYVIGDAAQSGKDPAQMRSDVAA